MQLSQKLYLYLGLFSAVFVRDENAVLFSTSRILKFCSFRKNSFLVVYDAIKTHISFNSTIKC